MRTYLRLLAYAKPYWRVVVPFCCFTIVAVFFSIFQFTLLIPLLNFLFGESTDAGRHLTAPEFSFSLDYVKDLFYYKVHYFKAVDPIHALYLIASVIVVAVVMANLFRYLAQRTLVKARTLLVKRLREAVFEKINQLHMGYFTREHKGDLLSRMNSDVFEIEAVATNSLEVLFKEPYMLIGYFIALFAISPQLTFFTLLVIPISAVGIALVTKRLRREAQATQASIGRLLTIIDETLMGMRMIRSLNATPYVIRRFSKENDLYRKASLEGFARRELAPAFSEASGIIVVAAILIYGGSLILQEAPQGGLQASEFITFLALFSQVIRPAKAMVVALANIQRGRASGERILEVLDQPVLVRDKADAIDLDRFRREIRLENVSFSYGDVPVLKNITLTLTKGRTVALVGPSGVGKSTLADLIPRFYDVTSGRITIDGYDIRDVRMNSLRRSMSFVTQDTILFNDTIFNNIAFGIADAKVEDVIRAARIANAHEFIMATEHGYHTIVGDRGSRLSGGQRQRLSIARAVFRDPAILILDEATSALDAGSEKAVQDALSKLMEGRTTLVIAHRLSTIHKADEICILRDGRIVERGSHAELIGIEQGEYRKLAALHNLN